MNTLREDLAMEVDPFDGDFGNIDDRTLSDKIVTIRKPRPCSFCKCEIAKGERARAMTAMLDGTLTQYTWCAKCLDKMIDLNIGAEEEE